MGELIPRASATDSPPSEHEWSSSEKHDFSKAPKG